MANNTGTLIISEIRPQSEFDTIATVFSDEVRGGWHNVSNTTERDAIYDDRKQAGMACYVTDISAAFVWDGNGWNSFGESSTGGVEYVTAPTSPTDPGTQGQRAYDSNYVYECIATNTWVRYAAASSW